MKDKNYTIKMTEQQQRDMNRYEAYYNANKLAYLMSENFCVTTPRQENKRFIFDVDNRDVEEIANNPKQQ